MARKGVGKPRGGPNKAQGRPRPRAPSLVPKREGFWHWTFWWGTDLLATSLAMAFSDATAFECNACNYRGPPVPLGSSETSHELRLRLLLREPSTLPFLLPPCLPNQPLPLDPFRISRVHFQRSPWSYICSTFMSTQA